MNFQELILRLHTFWKHEGCLILHPYDVETGAGTFNPATFFGALGPEPRRIGYVEPSRRPTDGRYGENPIRLRLHHQYQAVLKPPPATIQEMFLASLEEVGLKLAEHDIKFAEDNWESPTLAAWGVGWQVWFDEMEITQFTYFQQMGGIALDPISVEITYGLERIALLLQGKESAYDLDWNDEISYRRLWWEKERQFSAYNFEHATVERIQTIFSLCAEECRDSLTVGLIFPAYDYALKCSHLFNVLDARGAISVTERESFIGRIRDLTKECARGYLKMGENDA
jgi:glycyl-tRNA synthetase alpha chain